MMQGWLLMICAILLILLNEAVVEEVQRFSEATSIHVRFTIKALRIFQA